MIREVLRQSGLRFSMRSDFQVDADLAAQLRLLPYIEQWRRSISEGLFHIKLDDHSLLVFDTIVQGYRYLACPLAVPSFHDFLLSIDVTPTAKAYREMAEEYDLVIETSPVKNHITPVRYDLDKPAYQAGVHPAGHLHIGLENEIRLALRREMTPLSFTLLIIRQLYPENWRRVLSSVLQSRLQRYVRGDLLEMTADYFGDLDLCEVYFQ